MGTIKCSQILKLKKIIIAKDRFLHRKSLPPLVKANEVIKELDDGKYKNETTHHTKDQRDIFGATILPQNLSFENAKKLSENQIKLEDIPLIDEDAAAECLAAEKIKAQTKRLPKFTKREENFDSINIDTLENLQLTRNPAELFWLADPFEKIPGPKFFLNFGSTLKQVTQQVTVASIYRIIRTNNFSPFKFYGPIIKLPEILGGKIILISRPEHVSSVFQQDDRPYTSSFLESVERSRSFRKHKNPPSIFHLSDEWENIRNCISEIPVESKEKYYDFFDEATEKFINRIKVIRNSQNEVPGNFLNEINKWSLECLCSIIFNKSVSFLDSDTCVGGSSKSSQLFYSLNEATKSLFKLETGFQFWRFMNTTSLYSLGTACKVLESVISEYVAQVQLDIIKNKNNCRNSSSMIENFLLQEKMSPNDVVSRILDILLIGMNTMSSALGFLFYHLSTNPRVQVEIWSEIKKILPEKYTRLEYEHLSSFKYIQACLKESLRLKMPLPIFLRVVSKNITLSNYQIPKGTLILMTNQVECMKEDNFEEPEEFLPERWLEQGMNHPFTSFPLCSYFDDGMPRKLAELSLWICAINVSRHFTIDYMYEDIKATVSTVSFPNKPLKLTFTERFK